MEMEAPNWEKLRIIVAKNVFRIMRSYNMLDDICQETFIKVITNKRSRSLTGYVHVVSRNMCYDIIKKKAPQPLMIDMVEEERQKETIPIESLGLHGDDRTLIAERYIEGFSINEISELANKSREAVRTHLCRALKKVRKHLAV